MRDVEALQKLGFVYVDNLDVYQLREHEGYGAEVVEITLCNGTAQIFLTDCTYDWCATNAIAAIKALKGADCTTNISI